MNFLSQIRDIYNKLSDQKSKVIFENRLLYSFTEKGDFIDNMVSSLISPYTKEEYLQKIKVFFGSDEIIAYGAGQIGRGILRFSNIINIKAFCDSLQEKWGSIFHGYNVISPEELVEKHSDKTVFITVLNQNITTEITEALLSMGFPAKQIINYCHDYNNIHPFIRDGRMREQYFDKEIISLDNAEEIFIDAGCFDFGTSLEFIEYCGGNYKKIIAFEPNPEQYLICKSNAGNIRDAIIEPYGLYNENAELLLSKQGAGSHISDNTDDTVKIKVVKLDDVLNGEKVTFIKMDIEGAELNALKGAEQTILKHRPKLEICVYHKPEDIWEIPNYILSLHSDYKLYFRHYTFWASETVLYAV